MDLSNLPALNATLNAISAVCLISGFTFIRRHHVAAHRACMLTAVFCSLLFLISYITYHSQAGVTRFAGTGWSRPLYFGILWTHTPLAATIVPLIVITLKRALKADYPRHRRIARWTLPLWLYVSVTGVLIYFMLYHWFPSR